MSKTEAYRVNASNLDATIDVADGSRSESTNAAATPIVSSAANHARAEVQVDGQTAESWADVLHHFRDATLYQSWAYGAVRWGERHLSHLVVRRDGNIVGAAQVRIAKTPLLPLGVAYVRWGPLYHREGNAFDPRSARLVIRSLRDEYATKRGLALRIIPHAFSADASADASREAYQRYGFDPQPAAPAYRTVLVDLTLNPTELRSRLDKKWRNQLNGAEKYGLEIEHSSSSEAYRTFATLYYAMRERKRFETTVDVGEFEQILGQLSPADKMRTFIARSHGEPVAAVVCSHLGDTGIYLLGASDEKGRMLKAAYLLHWQVINWLKERGAVQYDLGGVDQEYNPGGYHFKSGFGGLEVEQTTPYALHAAPMSRIVGTFCAWRQGRRASSRHRW